MNKNFILFDKNNNIQRTATAVVKFNFEGKEYLIYSVEENDQNDQIFVSRIVLNSEGKTFIDNIFPEEKNKLNNVVYNIVILVPSEAQKGSTFAILSNELRDKYSIEISMFSSVTDVQEYYKDCSVAITSKILVDNAIKFYDDNLNNKVEEVVSVPTWTSPVDVTAPVPAISVNEEIKTPEPVIVPVQEPIVQVNVQPNVVEPIVSVEANVVGQVEQTVQNNVDSIVSEKQPNPQIEKLAIVSDPSLGFSVSQPNSQPNFIRNKKAGFANSKYIIIGTVCLVLAIAVVVVAYFLIRNMK